MKFVFAVVLLALALGAQSSVIPYGAVVVGPHAPAAVTIAESPVPVPAIYAAPHGSVAIQASAVHAVSPYVVAAVPSPVQVVSGPAVVPAHVVAAHIPAPAGTFVAKTRGAVHVAPLPGHVQSVVSANLEPAPGTH